MIAGRRGDRSVNVALRNLPERERRRVLRPHTREEPAPDRLLAEGPRNGTRKEHSWWYWYRWPAEQTARPVCPGRARKLAS